MSAIPLSTLPNVPNYQTWLDQLDVSKPIPKLIPRLRTGRVEESTASSRSRIDAHVQAATARQQKQSLHHSVCIADSDHRQQGAARSPRRRRGVLMASATGWESAFFETPAVKTYLQYLLSYGSIQQLDQYQPQELSREVHAALLLLFELLDRAGEGRYDLEDVSAASRDAFATEYNIKNFARMDKGRAGALDFIAMLRLFFPQVPSKKLAQAHEKFSRPPERIPTTRELMAPADVAAIDTAYDQVSVRPGGFTLRNLLSVTSSYTPERVADYEDLFASHDGDNDGILTREEFMEMIKSSYAPFRKDRSAWKATSSTGEFNVRDYDHWISKDGRVFLPRLPLTTARPYGQTELTLAKTRCGRRIVREDFDHRATLLHFDDTVKKYAGGLS
jgi:hypothetical protein